MEHRIEADLAAQRLDELVDRVAAGEEFVITLAGKPAARLVLPDANDSVDSPVPARS